jgi:hypothetical protein
VPPPQPTKCDLSHDHWHPDASFPVSMMSSDEAILGRWLVSGQKLYTRRMAGATMALVRGNEGRNNLGVQRQYAKSLFSGVVYGIC